jgi:hypothetical protein
MLTVVGAAAADLEHACGSDLRAGTRTFRHRRAPIDVFSPT